MVEKNKGHGPHDAALALRICDYLKLFRCTSDFGKLTFYVRHGEVEKTDVTIYDHRPFKLET